LSHFSSNNGGFKTNADYFWPIKSSVWHQNSKYFGQLLFQNRYTDLVADFALRKSAQAKLLPSLLCVKGRKP
jgi:hypothetical protein